jgi:LPXTG-site transpeptidase (sortase) family protein
MQARIWAAEAAPCDQAPMGTPTPAAEAPASPTLEPARDAATATVAAGAREMPSTLEPTIVPVTPTATAEVRELSPTPEPTRAPATPAPPATRLEIPTLGVDAPVVEVPLTDSTWDVSPLTQEIGHLGRTGNPGEKNNMVLAGHVTLRRGGGPFLRLEELEAGDVAIVYAGDQAYVYRVVRKKYLEPSEVSVTYSTSDPILTLITCASGSWDVANRSYTQRVAIICELVGKKTVPADGSQET